MNEFEMECHKCEKTNVMEVVEMKEGKDCWLEISLKCPECGHVNEIRLFS